MKKLFTSRFVLACVGTMMFIGVQAQPAVSAPTPPVRDANNVVSVFSGAYENLAGVNFRPEWGQTTAFQMVSIADDDVLEYSNLNYEGIELFADQCVTDMTFLHIDVWTAAVATLGFSPINRIPQQEQPYSLALTGGVWDSFDIPLSFFNPATLKFNSIYQFKIDGGTNQTIYVDNIYFYNALAADNEAPTDFTAAAGAVTKNSIELLLSATDNSGAVFFDVTSGGTTFTTGYYSGEQLSYIVKNLEDATPYSFSITVRDRAGNAIAAAQTVSETTLQDGLAKPMVAAPAPEQDAANVISIYSDTYTTSIWYNIAGWGGTTNHSTRTIGSENMLKLEDFNYLGIELNGNTAIPDCSEMTYLHVDVWTPNGDLFKITPIGGGETLVACEPIVAESWNSYDIPVTAFTAVDLANIIQIKMVGNEVADAQFGNVYYVDNIYFWKETTEGINQNAINNVNIFSNNGILYIQQAENKSVNIYNIVGTKVYSAIGSDFAISLEQGAYIVNIGGQNLKVLVK
ncbi:MAG: DUF6383 domain-containing protein [Prevotellaceae bacterium]|jgi:hypothetical protein|nr:DUF6383 domain-containing protein [Prevotellaceae bacterium]